MINRRVKDGYESSQVPLRREKLQRCLSHVDESILSYSGRCSSPLGLLTVVGKLLALSGLTSRHVMSTPLKRLSLGSHGCRGETFLSSNMYTRTFLAFPILLLSALCIFSAVAADGDVTTLQIG